MARTLTLNRTYLQMQGLIAGSDLNTQTYYKITDRGDNGLLFRAAAVDRLESDGLRYMLCPATYASGLDAYSNDWIGVWNSVKQATATEGQLCIWNGLVWTAGATMDGLAPDTETSGWTVIPKATFSNNEYVEMIFGISYDFDNDWISKQWDNYGNIWGANKSFVEQVMALAFNPVDYCDWNSNTLYGCVNNTCLWVYNNSNGVSEFNNFSIFGNSGLFSAITNNSCSSAIFGNTKSVLNNSNNGGITNNNCDVSECTINGNIDRNNGGSVNACSSLANAPVNIQDNHDFGTITGVWDADVTDVVVDKTGTAE